MLSLEDYLYWQLEGSAKVEKINDLIKNTQGDAFKGLGKPEPLKGALSGYWSRRISEAHRMVYKVSDGDLLIVQLCYHY